MDEGEGEGGGGGMLGKKRTIGAGEVDYKEKSGTAWSHSYLNQKPWHPLSYPNQRRKWIAEQTDAQKQRRAEEVAREFAQEQEFFRQTALISKKEKEKVEMMKAVSFMYVRPPGYNAESAKAAEIEDERKPVEQTTDSAPPQSQSSMPQESSVPAREKKKGRPKDVFGRSLPTEEEFEVLKNAPRMETGIAGRAKPFGVEIRNVKCARCGAFGHQSGDRECPLKDAIMPNEQSRLIRDDPLTSIMAHAESSEPLKWELKQKPGMSPPRGGFKPDDPNQQIVAEDIFDEYGGFLYGEGLPELLTSFSLKKSRKHSSGKTKKKQRLLSPSDSDATNREKSKKEVNGEKHKKRKHLYSSDSPDLKRHRESKRFSNVGSSGFPDKQQLSHSESDADRQKSKKEKVKRETHERRKHLDSPESPNINKHRRSRRWCPDLSSSDSSDKDQLYHSDSDSSSDTVRERTKKLMEKVKSEKHKRHNCSDSSENSDFDTHRESRRRNTNGHRRSRRRHPSDSSLSDNSDKDQLYHSDSDTDRHKRFKVRREEKHKRYKYSESSDNSDFDTHRESNIDSDRHHGSSKYRRYHHRHYHHGQHHHNRHHHSRH